MVSSIVNNLGYGSGIDIPNLISDLAAASREPKVKQFADRIKANQAKISAVAQARGDLDTFASSLAEVVAQGNLQTQPSVSDATVLGAVAAQGTRLGNFAGAIEVTQLARGQSIYSGYTAVAADPIGQGTLTLNVGGTDYPITIGSGNDSLTGLAEAINASGSGVTANIVTDSNGARIVMKGGTGTAKAFTLTPTVGNAPGLDNFAFSGVNGTMSIAQSAQNAEFKLDGLPYSRATNSFSDVIPGVTLTLKKALPGTDIAVGTTRPTDTIKSTIADFVSVYNTLKRDIAAARTATGGDQALRGLELQVGRFIGQAVTSHASINSLSDIGISTNRDGTITLDSKKLTAVLASDPDAVEAIFAPTRDATHTETTDPGLSGAFKTLTTSLTAENSGMASLKIRLEKEAAALTKSQTKMEEREAANLVTLNKKFGNLDSRLNAFKATQSYLTQQVAVWTNSNN